MNEEVVKIVVYVPESHADAIREALGKSGAGKIGNYDFTSFSVKGTGRFRPLESAHPTVGIIGKITEVIEERIETVCYKKDLGKIIREVRAVHPYEDPAIDVYPMILDPHETARK